jgi:hypothetical protein
VLVAQRCELLRLQYIEPSVHSPGSPGMLAAATLTDGRRTSRANEQGPQPN